MSTIHNRSSPLGKKIDFNQQMFILNKRKKILCVQFIIITYLEINSRFTAIQKEKRKNTQTHNPIERLIEEKKIHQINYFIYASVKKKKGATPEAKHST